MSAMRSGLAVAVVLGAAALSGCGKKAATRQDVIAQANAICTRTLRDVRSVPPPAGAALDALSPYLRRVVPIVDKEVAGMKALPRPDEDRAVLDQYVAAVAKSGQDYRALANAARSGDQAAVAQTLDALTANSAPALARRYGITQCATIPASYRQGG
jgi:hypothetical protein